jgi:ParB family chromosome partitioning protein
MPTTKPAPSRPVTTRRDLPIERIVPDPSNRPIEDDEDLRVLTDSIRVLGVLSPLHVRARVDQSYDLIDGERRWQAATLAGLTEVPCEVWPAGTDPKSVLVAGVVLNEQRKAHSCIHIARRLREIKNTYGLTAEGLSAQVGIPLDRVKTYSALFAASDYLLSFLEGSDVPLKVAAELMRFEKSSNEAKARQLVERYRQSPLSRDEIVALRRRVEKRGRGVEETRPLLPTARRPFVTERDRAEFKRDPGAAVAELQELLGPFGYLIVEDASQPARGA